MYAPEAIGSYTIAAVLDGYLMQPKQLIIPFIPAKIVQQRSEISNTSAGGKEYILLFNNNMSIKAIEINQTAPIPPP